MEADVEDGIDEWEWVGRLRGALRAVWVALVGAMVWLAWGSAGRPVPGGLELPRNMPFAVGVKGERGAELGERERARRARRTGAGQQRRDERIKQARAEGDEQIGDVEP